MSKRFILVLLVIACSACGKKEESKQADTRDSVADVYGFGTDSTDSNALAEEELPEQKIDSSRLSGEWKQVVELDSARRIDPKKYPENYAQLTPDAINKGTVHLPVSGKVEGPTIAKIQILLDRAKFFPGSIDGKWGKNIEKAVYWMQKRENLPATGQMDNASYKKLYVLAGAPKEVVYAHTLSAEDIKGPFAKTPKDIYQRAKMRGSYYESLPEKLGEMFHSNPVFLAKLNPGKNLDALKAGEVIYVPNVTQVDTSRTGMVAKINVSGQGFYVHALDSNDRLLYHFPTTLGASYDPSPQGDFIIRAVRRNPAWHYQPKILAKVPDHKKDAVIPGGPNNAVGKVWMALSVPHYGIHGTMAPETIGYAQSAGCVRLTNWNVEFLSYKVEPGVKVYFRDTRTRAKQAAPVKGEPPAKGKKKKDNPDKATKREKNDKKEKQS